MLDRTWPLPARCINVLLIRVSEPGVRTFLLNKENRHPERQTSDELLLTVRFGRVKVTSFAGYRAMAVEVVTAQLFFIEVPRDRLIHSRPGGSPSDDNRPVILDRG